jgi:hypothetical protein
MPDNNDRNSLVANAVEAMRRIHARRYGFGDVDPFYVAQLPDSVLERIISDAPATTVPIVGEYNS